MLGGTSSPHYNPLKEQQVARHSDAGSRPDQLEGEGKRGYVQPAPATTAVQGATLVRAERAVGTFPESPQHQTSSYMTTPTIPTRL